MESLVFYGNTPHTNINTSCLVIRSQFTSLRVIVVAEAPMRPKKGVVGDGKKTRE